MQVNLWGKMSNSNLRTAELLSLQVSFEALAPQEILRKAVQMYPDIVLVTSFQPTGIITLHMMQDIKPDIPVLTLDTGAIFPQTETLITELTQRYNLNLIRVKPPLNFSQQADVYGDALWLTNPDLCCEVRKTQPLQQALQPYSAWLTGLRRDQSPTREATPVIAWDHKHNLMKLCPFATWTEEMVWTYIKAYDLPYNALHDQRYPSIGCMHCTQATPAGENSRAGRWVNSGKTECGIHTS